MSEITNYKKNMMKSLKEGLIMTGITIWFIPSIVLQLIEFTPKNNTGFVNWLFQFSHSITPNITSFKEIFSMLPDKVTGLLSIGNIFALAIILIFVIGCASITSASRQYDKLQKLRGEARDDRLRGELVSLRKRVVLLKSD